MQMGCTAFLGPDQQDRDLRSANGDPGGTVAGLVLRCHEPSASAARLSKRSALNATGDRLRVCLISLLLLLNAVSLPFVRVEPRQANALALAP